MASQSRLRSLVPLLRAGASLLFAAAGVSAVFAAAVVVLAGWSGSWWWSLTGGGGAAMAIALGICRLARRRGRGDSTPASRHSLLGRPFLGPALLAGCAGLLSATWLWPTSAGSVPSMPGTARIWLPDGTHLAVHVTRATSAIEAPLIVVHGGPGVADMAHDAPAFAALATNRDVYLYDQIGTGSSSRLADPAGYTDERAVRDLEAVRAWTGAERVALLGHSWGARVATLYLATYPDRVAALVLSAPGEVPIAGATHVPSDPVARLDAGERAALYVRLARPRNLFAYALTAADPQIAHAVAGDPEMDRRFAAIYRRITPALFCDPNLTDRLGTDGLGFYANQIPQLHPDTTRSAADPAVLKSVTIPVLVIKPACDYIPWRAGTDQLNALPTAQLVVLPGAGHQAYLERPQAYSGLVLDFLAGRPLPLPTYTGSSIPDTYRGIR